jgi:hypothetical protein
MIKMIFMLKRRPGMSREAFIERYENGHAQLGAKHVGDAARYVRRYLEPIPELFTGEVIEPDHDVITELWFDSQDQYERAMQRLAEPDAVAEIVADEEGLFDRSKHRVFMVDERDTQFPGK